MMSFIHRTGGQGSSKRQHYHTMGQSLPLMTEVASAYSKNPSNQNKTVVCGNQLIRRIKQVAQTMDVPAELVDLAASPDALALILMQSGGKFPQHGQQLLICEGAKRVLVDTFKVEDLVVDTMIESWVTKQNKSDEEDNDKASSKINPSCPKFDNLAQLMKTMHLDGTTVQGKLKGTRNAMALLIDALKEEGGAITTLANETIKSHDCRKKQNQEVDKAIMLLASETIGENSEAFDEITKGLQVVRQLDAAHEASLQESMGSVVQKLTGLESVLITATNAIAQPVEVEQGFTLNFGINPDSDEAGSNETMSSIHTSTELITAAMEELQAFNEMKGKEEGSTRIEHSFLHAIQTGQDDRALQGSLVSTIKAMQDGHLPQALDANTQDGLDFYTHLTGLSAQILQLLFKSGGPQTTAPKLAVSSVMNQTSKQAATYATELEASFGMSNKFQIGFKVVASLLDGGKSESQITEELRSNITAKPPPKANNPTAWNAWPTQAVSQFAENVEDYESLGRGEIMDDETKKTLFSMFLSKAEDSSTSEVVQKFQAQINLPSNKDCSFADAQGIFYALWNSTATPVFKGSKAKDDLVSSGGAGIDKKKPPPRTNSTKGGTDKGKLQNLFCLNCGGSHFERHCKQEPKPKADRWESKNPAKAKEIHAKIAKAKEMREKSQSSGGATILAPAPTTLSAAPEPEAWRRFLAFEQFKAMEEATSGGTKAEVKANTADNGSSGPTGFASVLSSLQNASLN